MKEKLSFYVWLAGINLFISTFTFGGGYVVVPMIRKYYVQKKGFFTEDTLMEMAAVAQSTPGAIAINLTSLAGYQVAGKIGLLISCVCAVIPPFVILGFVSFWYSEFVSNPIVSAVLRGMQAGVAALIVDFAVDMANLIRKERSFLLNLLVVFSFVLSFFSDINVIFVILGSGALCMIWVWIRKRG